MIRSTQVAAYADGAPHQPRNHKEAEQSEFGEELCVPAVHAGRLEVWIQQRVPARELSPEDGRDVWGGDRFRAVAPSDAYERMLEEDPDAGVSRDEAMLSGARAEITMPRETGWPA
jgi:hypothetical protein